MKSTILSNLPYIQLTENFLSAEECAEIIACYDTSDPESYNRIVSADGDIVIDKKILTSKVFRPPLNNSFLNSIIDKIAIHTNFNKNRFETANLIYYDADDKFNLHQDFFLDMQDNINHVERCSKGGNRVSTILVYLNDVDEGGETYFPWLNLAIKPKTGNLLQFNYNHDNHMHNIHTQHTGQKVIKGKKWLLTIWVREYDFSTKIDNFRKYIPETEFLNIKTSASVEFSLEVGLADDTRLLKFELPYNTNPMNTIVVGFTGGMDSMLLLYMLGYLNSMLEIPYLIQPVVITVNDHIKHGIKVVGAPREIIHNTILTCNVIREKISGNRIFPLFIHTAPLTSKPGRYIIPGLNDYVDNLIHPRRLLQNVTAIYLGDNEYPPEDGVRFKNLPKRNKSKTKKIVQPFFNLQKHHIVDAIIKLNLFDIFKYTYKCRMNHQDINDICESFACNERRWGFTNLNENQIGDKYFIKGA